MPGRELDIGPFELNCAQVVRETSESAVKIEALVGGAWTVIADLDERHPLVIAATSVADHASAFRVSPASAKVTRLEWFGNVIQRENTGRLQYDYTCGLLNLMGAAKVSVLFDGTLERIPISLNSWHGCTISGQKDPSVIFILGVHIRMDTFCIGVADKVTAMLTVSVNDGWTEIFSGINLNGLVFQTLDDAISGVHAVRVMERRETTIALYGIELYGDFDRQSQTCVGNPWPKSLDIVFLGHLPYSGHRSKGFLSLKGTVRGSDRMVIERPGIHAKWNTLREVDMHFAQNMMVSVNVIDFVADDDVPVTLYGVHKDYMVRLATLHPPHRGLLV